MEKALVLPLLEAKQIKKAFHYPSFIQILNEISIQVYGGESVAIIGRSGEGKSTLLQILGSLENPSEGSLIIEGEKVTSSNQARLRNTKMGFVFQSFHLLEDYSVLENVLMPAAIGRKSIRKKGEAETRALSLLDQVGLAERAHFRTKLLSGGEKQRVAFARALCNDPSLILADEPSGNLDRANAHIMYDMLLNFSKHSTKALIVVTHDEELAHLCSRRYELSSGQLIELF